MSHLSSAEGADKYETISVTFQEKIDDISSSIKEVYKTLHKLETQYCDILLMKNDIDSLRGDSKNFDLRLKAVERKAEDKVNESKSTELEDRWWPLKTNLKLKSTSRKKKLGKKSLP